MMVPKDLQMACRGGAGYIGHFGNLSRAQWTIFDSQQIQNESHRSGRLGIDRIGQAAGVASWSAIRLR